MIDRSVYILAMPFTFIVKVMILLHVNELYVCLYRPTTKYCQ